MGRNGGKGGCLTGERAGDAAFDQEVEVVSLEAPDLLPLDYLKKKQLYILFKSLFQKKKKSGMWRCSNRYKVPVTK